MSLYFGSADGTDTSNVRSDSNDNGPIFIDFRLNGPIIELPPEIDLTNRFLECDTDDLDPC